MNERPMHKCGKVAVWQSGGRGAVCRVSGVRVPRIDAMALRGVHVEALLGEETVEKY